RATRLPDGWVPSQTAARWTIEQGLTRNEACETLEDFRDYWRSKPGKDTKTDWNLTRRRWVPKNINDHKYALNRRPQQARSQPRCAVSGGMPSAGWDAGTVYR